jgi:hypothetical protein
MLELLIAIGVNVLVAVLTAFLIYFFWTRKHRDPSLADASAALDLFQRQFPEIAGTTTLTTDGRNALIDLQGGSGIGLLQGHGRRWNARILRPGDVASVRILKDTAALRLKFSDYGSPRASLFFADAQERALWLARLQHLTRRASGAGDLEHA